MRCRDCRAWLQEWLDGEAALTPAAAKHLRACTRCRNEYALAKRAVAALDGQPVVRPPADFATKVLARATEARGASPTTWPWAAAAAVLLGLIGWQMFLRDHSPQRPAVAQQPASPVDRSPALRPDLARLFTQRLDLQDARQATLGFTQMASNAAQSAGNLLPQWDGLTLPAVGDPLDATVLPAKMVGEAVSSTLEPVTTSAQKAYHKLSKLRSLIPARDVAQPKKG
jgi:hypothetical protein